MIGNRIFAGAHPRISERNTPDEAADTAVNCWLSKGYPASIPAPRRVTGYTSRFSNTVKTIFRYDGDGETATPYRFAAWNLDVDVVRMPFINDRNKRIAWSGDDYPRHTGETIVGNSLSSGPGIPISRRLGIPAPTAAPTVALGDVGTADTTELAEHHAWVVTFVSDLNEEGPPSPPTEVVLRQFNDMGGIQPCTLTLPTSVAYPSGVGDSGANRKRIYRTATGASGTTGYYLLAEVALATETYTDTVPTASLGEEMISLFWDPPPADLKGLTLMSNGVMAGFVGSDVYLSEPYQPHAWPTDYIVNVESEVVGMEAFGVTLVVGTVDRPYVINGVDPANASPTRMEFQQVCASKHSFAQVDQQGVVFAANEGLVLVGPQGGRFLSRNTHDRDDWQALEPHTFRSVYHDGSYIAFTDGFTYAFNPEIPGVVQINDADIKAVYHDRKEDSIFIVGADRRLARWKTGLITGDDRRFLSWRGKRWIGYPRTYSAAQVIAEDYPVTLLLYTKDPIFNSGAEQAPVSITVNNAQPFRLRNINPNSEWSYQVSSQFSVYEVRIGIMRDML